jgi:hypothetical protein
MQKKKINDIIISPITSSDEKKKKDDIFGYEENPTVLLLAQRGSGKTTSLYNIFKYLLPKLKERFVFIFASKVNRDPSWQKIIELFESNGIPVSVETSLYNENGDDQLEKLINYYESPHAETSVGELEHKNPIFIIDDLSHEIRSSKSVKNLMKSNRHLKSTVFISTQYLNDLNPDCINNFTHVFAFPNISTDKKTDKLLELFSKLGLSIPYDTFKKCYIDATAPEKKGEKSHNFLFIETNPTDLRKNLNEQYAI